MNASRRDLTRFLALGSAAVVIGVPVALIAATWQPLEPRPRAGRADTDNPEREPSQQHAAPAATPAGTSSDRRRPRKRDAREETDSE